MADYSRRGHWRTLLDGTRTWVMGHHVRREPSVTHESDADVFKRRADERAAAQKAVAEKKRKADLAAKEQKQADLAAKEKQKASILAAKKERKAALVAKEEQRAYLASRHSGSPRSKDPVKIPMAVRRVQQ